MDRVKDLVSRLEALPRSQQAALAAGAGLVVVGAALRWWFNRDGALSEEQRAVFSAAGSEGATRLTPRDVPAAAETCADALAQSPMMVACSKETFDAPQRRAAAVRLYNVLLRAAVPSSHGALALRTPANDAVAVWLTPRSSLSGAALLWHGGLGALLSFTGWQRRGRCDVYAQAVTARRARLTQPYAAAGTYYLLLAAAKPGPKAATSLAAVVKPVLQLADARGSACYVEVTVDDGFTLDTLTGLGFRLVEQTQLFEQTVLLLSREPGGATRIKPRASPPATPKRNSAGGSEGGPQ